MALNDILSSALSGLNATQTGLRTLSNNVANAGTAGYARETVALTTSVTAGQVTGVVVGQAERIGDQFLESNVYVRSGEQGSADVTASYLDQMQGLFGTPGEATSFTARMASLTAAATAMTSGAGTAQTAAAFVLSAQTALSGLRQIGDGLAALGTDLDARVGTTLDQVNGLLSQVKSANDSVARLQGLGASTAGAVDQRAQALEKLSSLIGITTRDQPDGRVVLESNGGAVLLDRNLRQLVPGDTSTNGAVSIRFGDGSATGETISAGGAGGQLGGLLQLRDGSLAQTSQRLGHYFAGLAGVLNAVSNANTAVPPPASLTGTKTALVASDALHFTGAATFAVTHADGSLVASTRVDFSALPATATVADAVAAINTGLGGAGTATFANGRLSIAAAAAGDGVAIGQDAASPSVRGGAGFAQVFDLNDLVQTATAPLAPPGFATSDETGFAAGQTATLSLRDSSGRQIATTTFTGGTGQTFGTAVAALNASPLGQFGTFALDPAGRIAFSAGPNASGSTIAIPSDSTDRFGSGYGLTALTALTSGVEALGTAAVRPDIVADPAKLPLARLQGSTVPGQKVLGAADHRGATAFVDGLATAVRLGDGRTGTIGDLADRFASDLGAASVAASAASADASQRRDAAVSSRDSFSGVNIDEELARMVQLQNSYAAAARVISTASQMYDALIAMVG